MLVAKVSTPGNLKKFYNFVIVDGFTLNLASVTVVPNYDLWHDPNLDMTLSSKLEI